jgi:hypothetical protein
MGSVLCYAAQAHIPYPWSIPGSSPRDEGVQLLRLLGRGDEVTHDETDHVSMEPGYVVLTGLPEGHYTLHLPRLKKAILCSLPWHANGRSVHLTRHASHRAHAFHVALHTLQQPVLALMSNSIHQCNVAFSFSSTQCPVAGAVRARADG